MTPDCGSPCCVPQRRILRHFSSLLRGVGNLWLTACAGWPFMRFCGSLRRPSVKISLRAGRRPALVGRGSALGMALPTAGRGVDRVGERGSGEGGGAAGGRSIAVEGGALARFAPERADHILHALGRHFLAVDRTRRTSDALVHQSAAEIVGPSLET